MLHKLVLVAAVALWLITSIAFLGYAGTNRQIEFDANGELEHAAFAAQFTRTTEALFATRFAHLNKRVVHIQQAGCGCNFTNNIHVAKIDSTLAEYGFSATSIQLSELPPNVVLPATPAVAIFDQNAKLAYLGPYSSGFFCSSSSAIVDSFLAMIMQQQHPGSSVVSDGFGCYCARR